MSDPRSWSCGEPWDRPDYLAPHEGRKSRQDCSRVRAPWRGGRCDRDWTLDRPIRQAKARDLRSQRMAKYADFWVKMPKRFQAALKKCHTDQFLRSEEHTSELQ